MGEVQPGLRQHERAGGFGASVLLIELLGKVTGEAEGFVSGDRTLNVVVEEDPLVRLVIHGGLGEDAQGSVGPGNNADVIGMLAVGVVGQLK